MRTLLDAGADVEAFWATVEQNLRTYAELYEAATPAFRRCVEHVDRWATERVLGVGTARKSRKVLVDGLTAE